MFGSMGLNLANLYVCRMWIFFLPTNAFWLELRMCILVQYLTITQQRTLEAYS